MISRAQLKTLLPLALRSTNLPLGKRSEGKVRDRYALANGECLIVTTDRLSAFDRVLACVPYKGQVLNQLAAWWFDRTADIFPNHIISIPDPNVSVVASAQPFFIEVIVRGYITGVTSTSLWHRYALGERHIYGYTFTEGLKKNQILPVPIITPTTKGGKTGHDEQLDCAEVVKKGYLDSETWELIQSAALAIFDRGQRIAKEAGLILVDTKYEFGLQDDGSLLLIDEIHTPDSSRFWKMDTYAGCFELGKEPDNYDKEFVRLAYIEKGYRGDGRVPRMSDELWVDAGQRYISVYEQLTRSPFLPGEYPIETRLRKLRID